MRFGDDLRAERHLRLLRRPATRIRRGERRVFGVPLRPRARAHPDDSSVATASHPRHSSLAPRSSSLAGLECTVQGRHQGCEAEAESKSGRQGNKVEVRVEHGWRQGIKKKQINKKNN